MSIFGNASSGGQSNNATTSSAPSTGGLFGSSTPTNSTNLFSSPPAAGSSFSFGNLGGGTNPSTTTPTAPPGTSGGGLFSSAAKPALGTTPTSNTPGSSGATGGLFGNSSQTPTSNLFGGGAKPAQSTNLFGNTSTSTPPSGTANQTTTPPTAGSFSSGAMFGGKENNPSTSTPTSQPGGMFGTNAGSSASNIFGSSTLGNTQASKAPAPNLLATPAKPTFSNLNSTTPAGAPPTKPTASLFGNPGAQGASPFASAPQADKKETQPASFSSGLGSSSQIGTAAQPSSSTTGTPSLLGNAGQSSTSTSTPNLFGGKPTDNAGGLFGAKAATAQSGTPTSTGLFGQQAAKTAETPSTKPANALFGGTSTTPAAPATQSLFPNLSKPASTNTTSETTPKPATSMFAGKPAPSEPANSTTTSSLFGGKPTSAAGAPAASATASAPTSTTTTSAAPAPAASSMFGASSKAAPAADAAAAQTATGASSTLGASTAGPTSSMARLKNKTMDEIITRWATDLSKYQKEFKDQAAQVAQWDRLLVENGERIQKLYLETFEAEKGSREIERQLVGIESQQEELESWLDRYEGEVDAMFSKQLGHGEQLTGPDQEREKTYKLAEKITERLDDMGRDLSKMIKEINEISSTVSKGSKPDDPLSQIVRVLNGHLSQLQWIDTNAAALQAKVAAAQKERNSISSHYGGPEQENVESFYRSYMGRR